MLFDRSSQVAVQALVFLAQQSPGKLSPTHEIALQAGVPGPYLAKIFQRLTNTGLVRTFRGSGKGVELGRPAESIRLSSVVSAVQGNLDSNKCVLGLSACSDENPCALHYEWLPLKTAITEMLEKTTLADLVRAVREHQTASLPLHQSDSASVDSAIGKAQGR
ncbi:MAG: hypothetical protein A3F68_05010 [Acidobacteria bacterium RIFCSPLOWO2_12_FULL_54_10]|nr:MAG: hypothetical protein A3F68_05010 [Acidobacteria bacterium RIFCSPLOWO2_12_FULL_54_10]